MQHLDEGTIHAWLDGALAAEEAARVELHVASCATCSDAVAEARGLIAASSRILTALDDVPRVGAPAVRDRDARGAWLVRWRIAAVIAVVAGAGALAVAVRRSSVTPATVQAVADPGNELAFVVADSPTAETAPPPVAESRDDALRNASPGRGAIGAVSGTSSARMPAPERDLAAVAQAESTPRTFAQVEVSAPPAAPAARTDGTVRAPAVVASVDRPTPEAREGEARSSVAEKVVGALGGRRSVTDAPSRLTEPVAPQAQFHTGREVGALRALTEERTVDDEGRAVVRRVYRVEETLVTLDERAPMLELEQRRAAAQVERAQERLRRLEERPAAPVETDAAERNRPDSVAQAVTTIRWVDSRGAEFTLSGAAPQEQLERIRKLLGY